MGTGPSGAHATLSSVVVSLMLAYPHSSALDPCSSRFLLDCDLLPSHGGPQLTTLPVSLPLSPPRHDELAGWLAGHWIACSAGTHAAIPAAMYIHISSSGKRVSECFGPRTDCDSVQAFPSVLWLIMWLPLGWRRPSPVNLGIKFWTRTEITSIEPGAVAGLLPAQEFLQGGRWAAQPCSVLLGSSINQVTWHCFCCPAASDAYAASPRKPRGCAV